MKPNELRLAVVAGVVFTLIATLICAQKLLQWQRQVERREHEAALHQLETTSLLEDAAAWLEKRHWVGKSQPVAHEGALEANAELDTVVKNATELGLTVQSQQLQETVQTSYYQQFGVTLTVKGDLEKVVKWMHGLLAPTQFRVVPSVRIVPDKETPSQVIVTVQFWRWYANTLTAAP